MDDLELGPVCLRPSQRVHVAAGVPRSQTRYPTPGFVHRSTFHVVTVPRTAAGKLIAVSLDLPLVVCKHEETRARLGCPLVVSARELVAGRTLPVQRRRTVGHRWLAAGSHRRVHLI